jgi:hypothetical protein
MGQLDYTLDLSLKRAWRLSYQEGMTKAQEFFRASSKLEEIGKQLPQNDQQASREFEEIEQGINCLYGERNKVFHALYCQDESGRRRRFARESPNPYRAQDEGLALDYFHSLRDRARYWCEQLNILTRDLFLSGTNAADE